MQIPSPECQKFPIFATKRYMASGPIVAMVWTGLGIIPIVRAMVGATRPMDAAPGSIRGDLCIDVGRNLIHASDSSKAAVKEVAMWFPDSEIISWRPASLEWTYEDEIDENNLPKCSVRACYPLSIMYFVSSLVLLPPIHTQVKYMTSTTSHHKFCFVSDISIKEC